MAGDSMPPGRPKRNWAGDAPETSRALKLSTPETQRRKRLYLLGIFSVALLGAIVAFIALVFTGRSRLHYLAIPITEYRDRLYPVNPWAEQDSAALQALFSAAKHDAPQAEIAYEGQSKAPLLRELDDLRALDAETVVVHLSGLARAWGGEVFILPADAQPDNRNTWIPLTTVLTAVGDCKAPNKLLILDIGKPIAEPRLGVLANDVAGQLQKLLEQREANGLLPFWVLTPCQRDQVALPWEDRQHSAFGYYLAEGLRGRADGYTSQGKVKEGRISVRELADYVRDSVEAWAVRYRNARQVPKLYGQARDFNLLEQYEPPPEPQPVAVAYPDWLLRSWQLLDGWWASGGYRNAPGVFRQAEAAVLRAEKRWRGGQGGSDAQRVEKALAIDLQELTTRYNEAQQAARLPAPRSIALETARGRTAAPAVGAALKELLAKVGDLAGYKPEDAKAAEAKLLDGLLKQSAGKEIVKDKEGKEVERPSKETLQDRPHFDFAFSAFDLAAGDDNPSAEKVRVLGEALRRHQAQETYVEAFLLRRLGVLAADPDKKWRPEAVHALLRAAQEGEIASAADPNVLPWVRGLIDAANAQYAQGEALVFAGGAPSTMEKARMLLQAANTQYQEVINLVRVLEEADQRSDEALALLPGLGPYLAARAQADHGLEADWIRAAREANALRQLLGRPPEQPLNSSGQLQRHLEELRRALNNLQRPAAPATIQQLLKPQPQPDIHAYLEIQALLECARLPAADRKALWTAGKDMSGQLNNRTLQGTPRENARAAQRGLLVITWLKAGGIAAAEELEQTKLRDAVESPSPAAWEALAEQLRSTVAVAVPRQFGQLLLERDLAGLDRLGRLLIAVGVAPAEGGRALVPAAQRRRLAIQAYCNWLADRCQQQSTALTGRPAAFFAEIATEYRQFAR